MPSYPVIPSGLCQCGCGARTTISTRTRPEYGHIAGQPLRFIKGHSANKPQYIVDPATECWIWQRKKTSAGYGSCWSEGRSRLAHRVFWEQRNGPIPKGHEVHHVCNNPSCVNPSHLAVLTHSEHIKLKPRKLDGEAVRLIRESSLRVCDLAKHFGVHQSHISKIRSGQRRTE